MNTEASFLDVDEEVVRLRTAVMRLARDLRKTAAEEGLTTTQSSVLATVVRRGQMPISQLAGAEGLNPTMLSRVIGHLEAAGLLLRMPDKEDKRSGVVQATGEGEQLVQRLRDRRTAELRSRIDFLDPNSSDRLFAALPALELLAGTGQVTN